MTANRKQSSANLLINIDTLQR